MRDHLVFEPHGEMEKPNRTFYDALITLTAVGTVTSHIQLGTGSLIPSTTASNAHPPLPSLYLALWWKASDFYPEVTRAAVLMVVAVGVSPKPATDS